MAISSTDCRDRVVRGMPVWYLVPDGVVQYIEKRGLYRDGPRRPRRGSAEVGHDDGRPAGDRPTYDRPPGSSGGAHGDTRGSPAEGRPGEPYPHLPEVSR